MDRAARKKIRKAVIRVMLTQTKKTKDGAITGHKVAFLIEEYKVPLKSACARAKVTQPKGRYHYQNYLHFRRLYERGAYEEN